MAPTTKQSTFVAVCFIMLVGTIAVTALLVYDVDEFLKVWAVVGTLLGVLTGAIPSFFFAVSSAKAEREREKSEEKVQTILALSEPQVLGEAARARRDLFAKEPPATGSRPGAPTSG